MIITISRQNIFFYIVACPDNWLSEGSDCYTVIESSSHYPSAYHARQACLNVGADLASLDSTSTRDTVYTHMKNTSLYPAINTANTNVRSHCYHYSKIIY